MFLVQKLISRRYQWRKISGLISQSLRCSSHAFVQPLADKYFPSPDSYKPPTKTHYRTIVVGGGHNGLVAAAYLARAGVDVLVLERRHCVGGASVTEEIIPGFKFSRAAYLAGLLRPTIIKDLNLEKFGFKYLPRNPSSFTPTLSTSKYKGKYLILGDSAEENYKSIAQFSVRDAEAFPKYEEFLGQIRTILQPLLDTAPPDITQGGIIQKMRTLSSIKDLIKVGFRNREVLVPFYELFVGPAQHILDRWFESDILKTTLATDAVIGALTSPKQNGSAYVLLHHVMGEAAGKKGVWAYVEGGMGAISESIASSARSHGAEIVTNATVDKIVTKDTSSGERTVRGVRMADGSMITADRILSGCSPYHTFIELMENGCDFSELDPTNNAEIGKKSCDTVKDSQIGEMENNGLPPDFVHHIKHTDFSCGAFKINCAVDKLPNFTCYPSPEGGEVGPMHRGTVHFECCMEDIERAYTQAAAGIPATRPVIEMTIPTSVDTTIAPPGMHIVQLFIQFAPYTINPSEGTWTDPLYKESFADRVFSIVDEYAPGFSSSVIGRDVLSPLDLEQIFGLHKGNIFHGSLSLHQLGYARPMTGYSAHRSPVQGLYMCSSGVHPGGGVMGAPGRNCARVVLSDLGLRT